MKHLDFVLWVSLWPVSWDVTLYLDKLNGRNVDYSKPNGWQSLLFLVIYIGVAYAIF